MEIAMAANITRRLVSLADAADILAVSTKTVRRYIADATAPKYRCAFGCAVRTLAGVTPVGDGSV